MTKILFLDMDGVMNSFPDREVRDAWHKAGQAEYSMRLYGIDADLARRLGKLVSETGCKIVFSTSWRYFKDHPVVGKDWRKTLSEMSGIPQETFIGSTPDMSAASGWDYGTFSRSRGVEIKTWLENNTDKAVPGAFTFCAVDDIVSDIESVIGKSHTVRTDIHEGLTEADAARIAEILSGANHN